MRRALALAALACAACEPSPPRSPSVASAASAPTPRARTEAGHPMPPVPATSSAPFPRESDRCPDTTSYERRPASPCVAPDRTVVWTPAIVFEIGKSTVRQESLPVLESLAALLVRNPEIVRLDIQGHVNDGDGSPYRVRRLDADRADDVKDALVKLGVDPKRLSSHGFGGDVPLYPPTSEEGQKYNRRIAFVITEVAAKAMPP